MTDYEIQRRFKAIEDNVNVCAASSLALMAALSSMPEAARIDVSKANEILNGLVTQQLSLAALEGSARALLQSIVENARRAQ
jgi:hypothetical protein